MAKSTISVFQFWKDNQLDQHFTLTRHELETKFTEWLKTRDAEWINYYSADRAIRFFITDKSGLSSVFEESEYQDMYEPLKEIYIKAHK